MDQWRTLMHMRRADAVCVLLHNFHVCLIVVYESDLLLCAC